MSKLTLDQFLTEDIKQRAKIKKRLEYLRGELEKECMSYGELAELQDLIPYIEPGDVQLLEAAGVPENRDCDVCGKELFRNDEGDWACEDDNLHSKEEER